ncbi:MAG: ABC transporter permease [Gemmatimonadales bacterium]
MSARPGPGQPSTVNRQPLRLSWIVLAVLVAFAWIGPLVWGVDPDTLDLGNTVGPPSAAHPLGTDESGRDVLARLMAGGRVTLLLAGLAALLAVVFGTTVGGLAGVRSGWVDAVLMRLTDAAMAVPVLFVCLAVLTFLGTSVPLLVLVIGGTSWMGIARLVRAEVATLRRADYVLAARALGRPGLGVFLRHLLPQLQPTLAVAAGVGVALAILTESALSFLGLGVQPPAASWGNMLTGAQASLYTAPGLALWPGICIAITVLCCNGTMRSRANESAFSFGESR